MSIKRKMKVFTAVLLAVFLTCSTGYSSLAGSTLAREKPGGESVNYTVQRGDCIWSLAQRYRVSPMLLAYVNNLDSESLLYEGDSIILPLGDTITYTVNEGDTLWSLAEKFGISIEEMVEHNDLEEAGLLLAGEQLAIPLSKAVIMAATKHVQVNIPKLENWPVTGVVSSVFGMRRGRLHRGTDIAADWGRPIKAVADGRVIFAGERGNYGRAVIIDHGNGFRSLYAHSSRLEVKTGERVREGQVIARIGSTGRSTGPHLHLELLYRGVPLNPEHYLPERI